MNNIHKFEFLTTKDKPFYLLNVSDVHYDSKKCDRKRLKRDFDQIKELDGKILINGDWFDVMGMKSDPRSIPNDIRPEYMKSGGSYLDLVVQDSFEFLKNYAENIMVIGYGNHETNIVKRQQTDPLKWLHYLLQNHIKDNGIDNDLQLGAYNGAIILKLGRTKGKYDYTKKIYYHHGSGGGAKRSKGILDVDILVSQNTWADIITSGHDHNKWHVKHCVRDLNLYNTNWKEREIDVIRSGSYKMKSNDFGWEVEKGFNQPTLGGFLIRFDIVRVYEGSKEKGTFLETKVTNL